MVSRIIANVLESHLGQYLELSDTNISMGSKVSLRNVRLKESAFSELGLPVKILHGKVSNLEIDIPWLSPLSGSYTVLLEGLHLLLVPSTSVQYNEIEEHESKLDVKRRQLQRAEDARALSEAQKEGKDRPEGVDNQNKESDGFLQKLIANFIKNLDVTINKVHIRYEDRNPNSDAHKPFAAGITLDQLLLKSSKIGDESGKKLKLFGKLVKLSSFAVYWKPQATLYSTKNLSHADDTEISNMFNDGIGSESNKIRQISYLLGPINSDAELTWCLKPENYAFKYPEIDLNIKMMELKISLTKLQYQDFLVLAQTFEFMSRGSAFRKYKARNQLENLPNYIGKSKELWKFAFDCVHEEEVTRRINNWSWDHMKEHVDRCKKYREAFKRKILDEPNVHQSVLDEIDEHEKILDVVNIRVQRQLAEREAQTSRRKEKKEKSSGGWFGWWKGSEDKKESTSENTETIVKKNLSVKEKQDLYDILDYQEDATSTVSIYPKSFVARKLGFDLRNLEISIRDDDELKNAEVLLLELASVHCDILQRPSANNLKLNMAMKSLTIKGLALHRKKVPIIVSTRDVYNSNSQQTFTSHLLNFCFENNPPEDSNADLDHDKGDIYEKSLVLKSSPLEIIYDSATFNQLSKVFHNPLDDITFTSLQQAASATVNELRESTRLALQYAVDNHSLIKVDAHLSSAHIIIPYGGDATDENAKGYAVAKLGSISLKSKPLAINSSEINEIKQGNNLVDIIRGNVEKLAAGDDQRLREEVYDKFDVCLKNFQMLVALPNEPWRDEMDKTASPLFLLKPTSINVELHHCLMKKDPKLPLFKVIGHLKSISVNIADYRLIKLAQIADSLITQSSEQAQLQKNQRYGSSDSMQSALSSLNTGSLVQTILPISNIGGLDQADISEIKPYDSQPEQLTKLKMNFSIDEVSLNLSQLDHNKDQNVFNFLLKRLNAKAKIKSDLIKGSFEMGSMRCTHLLTKIPNCHSIGVDILNTEFDAKSGGDYNPKSLLKIKYVDVKESNADFRTLHQCVLKHLTIDVAHVHINVHQNAILDLKIQIDKFLDDLTKKAKNLKFAYDTATPVDDEDEHGEEIKDQRMSTSSSGLKRKNANKRLSFGGGRKISMHTSAKVTHGINQWAARAKLKLKKEQEIVDIKIVGSLESVTMDLMTSTLHIMQLKVKDLKTEFQQTKSASEIKAQLIDLKVFDPINFVKATEPKEVREMNTLYEQIVTSMDKQVFDAKVTMYNHSNQEKALSSDIVDVKVEAQMGRINIVFLMKFVNDFLEFLEPFSEAKELVAEKATYALSEALEEAAKAYSNATRVQLDIKMFAPLIIIPVHSKSSKTFMADLGTLLLNNRFVEDKKTQKLFDNMHFSLKDLKLHRARIAESACSNKVIKQCMLIGGSDGACDGGITFELKMKRSMEPSLKKSDPAEFSVNGTLHQIKVYLSREDYNVMMALLQQNFSEKGQFLNEKNSLRKEAMTTSNRKSMGLPVKKSYVRNSRASSQASFSSEGGKSLKEAFQPKVQGKHPETKYVQFNFKFHGLEMEIFSGNTPLGDEVMHHPRTLEVIRDKRYSLAQIKIQLLSVKGELLANGFLEAEAFLKNLLLEDSRSHAVKKSTSSDSQTDNELPKNENRIIRLLEAKTLNIVNTNENQSEEKRMIDIIYKQEPNGNQDIEVIVHSIVVVVSISYLMEIANFFIPDQSMMKEFQRYELGGTNNKNDLPDVIELDPDKDDTVMSVYLKIEKPDIFLVEDILNSDSEALMLNTEIQLKYVSKSSVMSNSSAMSLISSMRDLTCHICKFKQNERDQSMVQILKPCDLSLSYSQPNGVFGSTRVNSNISDLCLNVSPRGLKIISKSIDALVQSMHDSNEPIDALSQQGSNNAIRNEIEDSEDYGDLWHTLPFLNSEFWFLPDESNQNAIGLEATENGTLDTLSSKFHGDCDEQAIINIHTLVIQIEAGYGKSTIPLLLLESSFNCDIRNWSSSRMSAIGTLEMEIACYNSKLALWEPVLEAYYLPVSKKGNQEGRSSQKRKLIKKRWSANITLQCNSKNDFGSGVLSPNFDMGEGFVALQSLPPLQSIYFQSTDNLEITITKTFLRILKDLQQHFAPESEDTIDNYTSRNSVQAPIKVKNRTGKTVSLVLENKGSTGYYHFTVLEDESDALRSQVDIGDGIDISLELCRDRLNAKSTPAITQVYDEYVSPLREQTEQEEIGIKVRVEGERGIFDVPLSKADKRFFPFPYRGDEMGDEHGMVCELTVNGGCKTLTLRSILQFKNYFSKTVEIFKWSDIEDDQQPSLKRLAVIPPDSTFDVPIASVYSKPYEFQFKISDEGENMAHKVYPWREIKHSGSFAQQIECPNNKGAQNSLLNIYGVEQSIFTERSGKLGSVTYNLDIRPLMIIKNCLPETLHYTVLSVADGQSGLAFNDVWPDPLEPGEIGHLQGVHFGKSALVLKIFNYRLKEWTSKTFLEKDMPELTTWKFYSEEFATNLGQQRAELDLGVNCTTIAETQLISIYAPFWMINKTGKMLTYGSKDPLNEVYHPSKELSSIPMMFSYTSNSGGILSSKRKARLRIDDSNWSEYFTLDTIEDSGKITCHKKSSTNTENYYVGVNFGMSKSSLTKIVTFTPFYVIQNTTKHKLELREIESKKFNVQIEPNEAVPFWPMFGAKNIVARVAGTKEITTPFSIDEEHTTLLMLSNLHGGLNVEVRISNSETMVTIASYKKGHAPVQMINHTSCIMIEYGEYGAVGGNQFLPPGEKAMFTWVNPSGRRALAWSIAGRREEYVNELNEHGYGVIELNGRNGKESLAWVSFLDGMQRVLLFSTNQTICCNLAQSTGENERLCQEIELSIAGIGISLVNNLASNQTGDKNHEIIYMRMSSSDVVWEIRKQGKTRYKSLTKAQCEAIEADFQRYSREKTVAKPVNESRKIRTASEKNEAIQLNYQDSRMFAPLKGAIRRQFQQGLWLKVGISDHQTQIHAKINHVQIDNQLNQCLFPVMLAPVPPPRSVVADSIPKPFFELSILQYRTTDSAVKQYKYICALVQELAIKVDQGLINALAGIFEEEDENLDAKIKEFLKEDLDMAKRQLKEVVSLHVMQGQKDFFDYLHLSPLKVHVSFSLTSYKAGKASSQRSNFFSLFLQSLGVTITDTDDIVFRLAYFERKHTFYSTEDVFNQMIKHYTSQAIKQAYVIIFGLDVIGNPFGLVVGVTQSVEDLFYEPFQGAVEGPGEFAEGLVIGVRSVFSGVVGGAAGTVSRITGAIGKGLATLTFDDKFKAKRREAIKKRSQQNFGESLARSGRGLVMGVFEGVTGVATKPIEGAKEEGVGGFFKGIDKY